MIEQLGETERDQIDRELLLSMRRDVAFVIEWLKKGHNPEEHRGIDRRYAYHGSFYNSIETIPDITENIEREPITLTKEQQRVLTRLFDSLSEREMDCFILHEGHHISMQEIADELGISKSSVQVYVERARKKAKEALNK